MKVKCSRCGKEINKKEIVVVSQSDAFNGNEESHWCRNCFESFIKMGITDKIKDMNNWSEDIPGIITYYLDSENGNHYEIILTSYNHKKPVEDNALGNLYFVTDYDYNGEKLFARICIGGEAPVRNLLERAASDFLSYEDS